MKDPNFNDDIKDISEGLVLLGAQTGVAKAPHKEILINSHRSFVIYTTAEEPSLYPKTLVLEQDYNWEQSLFQRSSWTDRP